MKQLLNTLYVMTQGSYLTLDHETVKVEVEQKVQMQVPLHHLGAIFTFGNVMISPFLMHKCMEDGRAIVLFNMNGRFMARVTGKTHGNVLLRQAQYEAVRDEKKTALIARNIVAGKLQNSRQIHYGTLNTGSKHLKHLWGPKTLSPLFWTVINSHFMIMAFQLATIYPKTSANQHI